MQRPTFTPPCRCRSSGTLALCLMLSALGLRQAVAQSSGGRGGQLVADTVLYSSGGVTGIVGGTVRADGTAFLVLRSGEVMVVPPVGRAHGLARLDGALLSSVDPVPLAVDDSALFAYDTAGPAILQVSLYDGTVVRRALPVSTGPVEGIAIRGHQLVLAGFVSGAPQYALHAFALPSLGYERSFASSRVFKDLNNRRALTGGTLNSGPDGSLVLADFNPPRLELFTAGALLPRICAPVPPFDDGERVAMQDSAHIPILSNAFPKARGAAPLGGGLVILSGFDIRDRHTRLLIFDLKCHQVRDETVEADMWIIGVDRAWNLYALRTYGDQDLVRYHLVR